MPILRHKKKYGYSLDDFLKMSFTQIHPEEKQLIEHKFTSEEEICLAITLHIF
jgi:hypothetical protein